MKQNVHSKIESSKDYSKFYFLIVFCIPFLVYLQTLSFGFVNFDDESIITNNTSFLSNWLNAPKAFLTDAFIQTSGTFYRPLQTLSYMLDLHICGSNAFWMFHLTNILLISCIALALFRLLILFNTNRRLALFAAIFYTVHPLFVSSIAWIPARGDLMLTLFSLFSIVAFIEYLNKRKIAFLIFHFTCFTFALFCKETAAFLPFIYILYYALIWKEKRFEKWQLFLGISYFIIGILWFYLRSKAIGDFAGRSEEFGLELFVYNLRVIPESLARFFMPISIAPIPSFTLINTILGIVFFCFIVFLILKKSTKTISEKGFFVIWFLLLLLPTLFYKQPVIDFLDHRFLLPLVGILLLCLTAISVKWIDIVLLKKQWIVILVIFCLSSYSFVKSRAYTNSLQFYDAAVLQNPNSPIAHFNRGCLKGKYNEISTEIEDYSKAISLKADYVDALYNRGLAYSKQGESDSAIADFSKAIHYRKNNFLAYNNRGTAYSLKAQHDLAIADFSKAISLKPDYFDAYYNRGTEYLGLHLFEHAIADYINANAIKPDNTVFYALGNIYRSLGKLDLAIEHYSKAISLKTDYTDAYNNRGTVYGMKGEFDNAISDFSRIIEIDPQNAESYNNRGTAFILLHKPDLACSDFTKAIQLGSEKAKMNFARYCNHE